MPRWGTIDLLCVSKVAAQACHKLLSLKWAYVLCDVLQSYPTDLGDASAVKATIAAVQQDLGPISVVFWNPYNTPAALLTATPGQLQSAYNVTVTGKPLRSCFHHDQHSMCECDLASSLHVTG